MTFDNKDRFKSPTVTTHYFTPQPLNRDAKGAGSPTAISPLEQEAHWTTARAHGHTLQLATGAGVFAKAGLDAGSQLLLETATLDRATSICDLGCGWGALGCFAATIAPQSYVWMCDINLRAVVLARLNLKQNNIHNATTWCGDGLSGVRPDVFDTVLCNPPVRAGNTVIAKLFDDAHRCLKSQGSLWVVLRTAQGAKSWQRRLQEQFGNCATIDMAHGYRILKSIK